MGNLITYPLQFLHRKQRILRELVSCSDAKEVEHLREELSKVNELLYSSGQTRPNGQPSELETEKPVAT